MPTNCKKCTSAITRNTYSICCSQCMEWFHKDCANLSTEEINNYAKELKNPNGKRFLCSNCNSEVFSVSNSSGLLDSSCNTPTIEDSLLDKVMNQLDKKLGSYFSNTVAMSSSQAVPYDHLFQKIVNHIDEKLKLHTEDIKCEIEKLASTYSEKIVKLEAEVESLKNTVLSLQNSSSSPQLSTDNLYGEIHDRMNRANNLMIYKVRESNSKNLNERVAEDTATVNDILQTVGIDSLNIQKVLRVGRTNNTKPRPIKVVLSNHLLVKKIINSRKKVEALGYSVGFDRTKLQQTQLKSTLNDLKRRTESGEKNLIIKYVNGLPIIQQKNQ